MNDGVQPTPLVDLTGATLGDLQPSMSPPRYDRSALRRSIVHIGVGGFHRAHLATYVDDLCRLGNTDWSIVGSGVTAADAAMADTLHAQDGLYTLIERGASHTTTTVIGSIVEYLLAAPNHDDLIARLAQPDVRLVSLTITEGGYPVDDHSGEFDPDLAAPAFDIVAAALDRRRREGIGPLTVLSCDNVIGNGTVARTSLLGVAQRRDPELARWIETEVAFPNSMVDRITPATTDADREWLRSERSVVDRWPVVAEPFRQWVVEDAFVGATPPFSEVGVLTTNDVEPYELLKLRMLNASHSCLAYLAALSGFEHVDEAMASDEIRGFVGRFLRDEAMPALADVPGVDVNAYADELVHRFSNPAIGDQIGRLCLDGSSKFPKFLLPTVRSQLERGGSVRFAGIALAGWCRYLQGSDDAGRTIDFSFDPRLDELRECARAAEADPRAFIGFAPVFGSDLASNERFLGAFSDALRALRDSGVRSTLDAALMQGTDAREPRDR